GGRGLRFAARSDLADRSCHADVCSLRTRYHFGADGAEAARGGLGRPGRGTVRFILRIAALPGARFAVPLADAGMPRGPFPACMTAEAGTARSNDVRYQVDQRQS